MAITAALPAQNKTALVVGNSQYTNEFSRLSQPVPEARAMASALESIGFEVIRAYNVKDQDRFFKLFEMFEDRVKARGGIALFHYGGHGIQVGGENYLLPTGVSIPDERRARSRGVSVTEVTSAIEAANPETSIIILDACRNDPYGRGGAARGLAKMRPPRNSLVVYAADAGESAQDGLFTPTLLKYLTKPGWDMITVLQRTRADVLAASNGKQSPGEYSQLLSDVYLAGRGAGRTGTSPSPGFELEEAFGSIKVSADTAGKLYMDGKFMGQIPAGRNATLNNIPVGRHRLEMRYGNNTENKSIQVQEGRTTILTFGYRDTPAAPSGFVYVEGGSFTMGSPKSESRRDDDETQHEVTVSSFYISQYEVTQAQWKAVMGSTPSNFKGDNRPVEKVSWYDAVGFCNALSQKEGRTPAYRINGTNVTWNKNANGYRLPTEAEWEYAARGGNKSRGYKYSGSNNVDSVGWYWKNSGDRPLSGEWDWDKIIENNGRTHNVGTKEANELGLYDMSGNVWEWCWDWFGDYQAGSQTEPTGPSKGSNRVLRGGCWDILARRVRVAGRGDGSPGGSDSDVGFRPDLPAVE